MKNTARNNWISGQRKWSYWHFLYILTVKIKIFSDRKVKANGKSE